MAVDPQVFHDIPTHMQSLQDAFSSISLSDALDALPDPSDAVDAAADAASEVAQSNNGWFGFLTGPIEFLLQAIHSLLVTVGMSADAWGLTIVAMTVVIKLATYPLTKTQLESTNKMQALQPAIKDIQAKYQSNPEVMNQKIAEMYQANNVNPLAGCLPSLVQIPIFIGLYRAVLDLAKENKLDEPFLWLPNLEGPVYGADPTKGSAWLFEGWTNGAPSLGWDDTIAFLILPVFLVVSQYVSMELMQPKDGPAQGNAVLKVLPLMIGWFSLNVPAALCVYWVTNNIITTATSVLIRNSMKVETVSAGGSATASPPSTNEIFAPPPLREKPAGFSSPAPSPSSDGVSPITSNNVIDAEIDDGDDEGGDDSTGEGMGEQQKKSRGKKKKKKRRKN
eukprot:CAMPEP_0176064096 /NCGR_PEP_ID=MMETSP0120_2-20121206/31968_1 /TAXON_ID=160619 /ORGANISM="Kryptoperidinium foliaceum, Strain CCMP 1326" /LENGTH=392 /DNA_ID=CAMNT_0017397669 /DNA_START=223 /DNA_END=1401 /DNA_ORIENTATION=-